VGFNLNEGWLPDRQNQIKITSACVEARRDRSNSLSNLPSPLVDSGRIVITCRFGELVSRNFINSSSGSLPENPSIDITCTCSKQLERWSSQKSAIVPIVEVCWSLARFCGFCNQRASLTQRCMARELILVILSRETESSICLFPLLWSPYHNFFLFG